MQAKKRRVCLAGVAAGSTDILQNALHIARPEVSVLPFSPARTSRRTEQKSAHHEWERVRNLSVAKSLLFSPRLCPWRPTLQRTKPTSTFKTINFFIRCQALT